jgi:hypothetical protein
MILVGLIVGLLVTSVLLKVFGIGVSVGMVVGLIAVNYFRWAVGRARRDPPRSYRRKQDVYGGGR